MTGHTVQTPSEHLTLGRLMVLRAHASHLDDGHIRTARYILGVCQELSTVASERQACRVALTHVPC